MEDLTLSTQSKSLWEKVKFQFTFQTEDFTHKCMMWGWLPLMLVFAASNFYESQFEGEILKAGIAVWQLMYVILWVTTQMIYRSQRKMTQSYGKILDSQFEFADALMKENIQLRKENLAYKMSVKNN